MMWQEKPLLSVELIAELIVDAETAVKLATANAALADVEFDTESTNVPPGRA